MAMVMCGGCRVLYPESTGRRSASGTLLCPSCHRLEPPTEPAAPAPAAAPERVALLASPLPRPQQPQEPSWWSQTATELWWLHLVIAFFLGLPFVDVLTKALSPGKLGPEEAVDLVNVFVATAPLVIALALSLALLLRYPTGGAAVASGAIFLLVTSMANDAALGSQVTPQPVEGGGPFHHTLTYLAGYLDVYGPALFLSGAAMGLYAGAKAHQASAST